MDYYSILGVKRNASPEEIKKAYKKKSMQHHPDRGGNQDDFVKVQKAYETLSNPQKKSAYDTGHSQINRGAAWSANQGSYRSTGQNPFENTAFNNIYEEMMRQGAAHNPRTVNKDITIAAKLTLEEIITGKNLIATYKLPSGKEQTVEINVPAGANESHRIRFKDLGDDRFPGPRGNLIVKIEILPHENWIRDKNDVYLEHSMNALDMIVGGVTIVNTLDGRQVQFNVPKGTANGKKFRLSGYGLPDLKTKNKGNAYVVLKPEIPDIQDETILRKLTKLRNNLDK